MLMRENVPLESASLKLAAQARVLLHCCHDLASDHIDLAWKKVRMVQNVEAAHIDAINDHVRSCHNILHTHIYIYIYIYTCIYLYIIWGFP